MQMSDSVAVGQQLARAHSHRLVTRKSTSACVIKHLFETAWESAALLVSCFLLRQVSHGDFAGVFFVVSCGHQLPSAAIIYPSAVTFLA